VVRKKASTGIEAFVLISARQWRRHPAYFLTREFLIDNFFAVNNLFDPVNLTLGDLVVGLAVAVLSISSLATLAFLVVFRVLIKLFFSMLMTFTPFEFLSV
jgi:hypothetical protein